MGTIKLILLCFLVAGLIILGYMFSHFGNVPWESAPPPPTAQDLRRQCYVIEVADTSGDENRDGRILTLLAVLHLEERTGKTCQQLFEGFELLRPFTPIKIPACKFLHKEHLQPGRFLKVVRLRIGQGTYTEVEELVHEVLTAIEAGKDPVQLITNPRARAIAPYVIKVGRVGDEGWGTHPDDLLAMRCGSETQEADYSGIKNKYFVPRTKPLTSTAQAECIARYRKSTVWDALCRMVGEDPNPVVPVAP